MDVVKTVDEDVIFEEMNQKITNISLEEYYEIEREAQIESDYTLGILYRIKAGKSYER
jgi:hypothetical protein